ncbi:MAG TPA: GTP 3',8-cyclase MoaA, partial [Candidatus Baltobacteraceae bacterium]
LETIDLIGAGVVPLNDQFNRPITYLRISVTDRCNLRCVYCMPETGLPWIPKREILTFEEIERIVVAGASVGVRAVRITGGEPLLRSDIVDLVARLNAIEGIDDIALSTNGILLSDYAQALRAAGLRRVNISLDTLQEERFFAIAKRPGLDRVLAGIDAAIDAGLGPLKLNCVIMRGQNDDEIAAFAEMTRTRPLFVRFIEVMPVQDNAALQHDAYISAAEVLERVRTIGEIEAVAGPGGNGPARYFAFRGAAGAVGVISPLSHDYCETCNRVRLSADGRLRLCLFGDHEIDLRTPLRNGATRDDIAAILRGSMLIKPERHHLQLGEPGSRMRAFSEIGG